DAINRVGLPPEQSKALLDSMPIAYAVSYMFGTVGSALVIALLGPKLLRINLPAACKDYEEKHGGGKQLGGAGSGWHRWELRAYRVNDQGKADGLSASQAEALVPNSRVFVQRVRRNGHVTQASADTVLHAGDVLAVAGAHRGRRARRGNLRRIGARRPPDLRPHRLADHLVHDLRRLEHFHRGRRHLRRAVFRQWPEDAGCRALPVGRGCDDAAANSRHVHR